MPLEEVAQSKPAILTPSEEVWFADGNLVLQAENIVFKVYQGILTQESSLFRDMLSLPQPPDQSSADIYEGCHLVKVQDTAEDITTFLSALHHYDFLLNQCDCWDLVALLRLAAKYQTETLRRRVVEMLQYVYPDTFEAYDATKSYGTSFPSTHPLHRLELDNMDVHIALINAAKAYGASVLLPAALVRLIFRHGLRRIVKAGPGEELTTTVLLALPKLSQLARSQTFAPLYADEDSMSGGCSTFSRCQHVQRRLRKFIEHPSTANVVDPFCTVNIIPGRIAHTLCPQCLAVFKNSYEEGRKAAWEKLPGVFGLPGWDDLRKSVQEFDDTEDDDPMNEGESEGEEA